MASPSGLEAGARHGRVIPRLARIGHRRTAHAGAEKPAITVGADLLPELAVGLRISGERSAWVVPSQTFQRHHCGNRESRHEIVQETSDPDRARKNWMDSDAVFAREVAHHASAVRGKLLTIEDIETEAVEHVMLIRRAGHVR
jgi:hypothetical protein